jgi:lipopolysaccharide transport protein LptA
MAITVDTRNARRPGRVPAAAGRVGQRAKAFVAAQRHSLLVAVLRIACPLAAVGILGFYALVAAISWSTNASRFKVGGVEITADDLTMKDPTYFDVTSDGRYEVRARRAVVSFDKKTPIKLIDVSGDLMQTSGTVTKLKAKHGLFDNAKGELQLFDGIEIDGSNGLMARLSQAMIYSKENRIVSDQPVSATMPTGSVQAASMAMSTKTKLIQFRGGVAVRLLAQGQSIGAGKDAKQPVDIRSEELDVDDAGKTAHFKGEKVVAVQGESMLQTPYLMVKYEGKAAPDAADKTGEGDARGKGSGAARVTFLWARNGVDITAGTDRRITSELADFDVAADTALFTGNVVATQEKNVLKGGRLFVDRKAGRSRLETPGEGGRIAVTLYNAQGEARPARQPTAAETARGGLLGTFKADRSAPMDVEANTLDLHDAQSKAVFSGNVAARQGDLLLRTSELTAFYSGKTGMGFGTAEIDAAPASKRQDKGEIVRLEARQAVILSSKDQSATAKWANFDVKGNTALLGGGVVITKHGEDPAKLDVIRGDRLKVDLTTGISQLESEPQTPAQSPRGPAVSSSGPAAASPSPAERVEGCPPGKQCVLIYPKQVKDRAIDVLKKKAPGFEAHQLR